MIVRGPRFTRQQALAGIAAAPAWRIANKPYFDAIYGPETRRQPCGCCAGTGMIEVQA